MGTDPGWLASTFGRNGVRMRTESDLCKDKMQSSNLDPIRNLLSGNYIVYSISEVIESFS
jgi:hypothetical protein